MMKTMRVSLALVWVVALAGCCSPRPTLVAVPEAMFRTEVGTSERLALPLDAANRSFLTSWLRAGGNRDNLEDRTLVDPEANQAYDGLLEVLAAPENCQVARLQDSTLFREWFPHKGIRQVVDARDPAPLFPQPIAFLDGRGKYWWIFYHRRGELTQLMVIKAMAKKPER